MDCCALGFNQFFCCETVYQKTELYQSFIGQSDLLLILHQPLLHGCLLSFRGLTQLLLSCQLIPLYLTPFSSKQTQ
jgi:hypothetical protein